MSKSKSPRPNAISHAEPGETVEIEPIRPAGIEDLAHVVNLPETARVHSEPMTTGFELAEPEPELEFLVRTYKLYEFRDPSDKATSIVDQTAASDVEDRLNAGWQIDGEPTPCPPFVMIVFSREKEPATDEN